jgi:hypothetical protein
MGAVNSSSFSAEVIDDGEMTGALPGKVLRGPRTYPDLCAQRYVP